MSEFQFQLAQDIPEAPSAPLQPHRTLTDVPIAEQPATLDRASLEFCLADAFHPGCEMTWPMRHPGLYIERFRIKHAPPEWIEPQYGAALTTDLMVLSHRPFDGQVPGGLTRWMAVPWQTDTASCRSGYSKEYTPFLPTFWPARVPNQVLAEDDYEIALDGSRPLGERLAAFAHRVSWLAPIQESPGYFGQINAFIGKFGQMGVVETREGPSGAPHFPATMEVESLPPKLRAEIGGRKAGRPVTNTVDFAQVAKVRRFPHGLPKG